MRRSVVLVGALATALLLLVVMLAIPPEKADAARKFRVVTKTFTNPKNIQINLSSSDIVASSPYPSKINAGGFRTGRILDVNLTLKNFSHTYPQEVHVLLAHRGKNRTVMADVSPYQASNITLALDDEAAIPLPAAAFIVSGRYKPTNYTYANDVDSFPAPAPAPSGKSALAGFDGSNPNGAWYLYVVDANAPTNNGQIAGGWSLNIKAKVRTRR
jgi:hypothetical protein